MCILIISIYFPTYAILCLGVLLRAPTGLGSKVASSRGPPRIPAPDSAVIFDETHGESNP